MNTRRANLKLVYENVDISSDLEPFLLGWAYTDNLSGQADDIQIQLEDKEQLWTNDWLPDKGAKLKATITRLNWGWQGQTDELSLGQFELDEFEGEGPPSTVTLKGISIPESSSLRGEEKSRAWEKTKLSLVAGDVSSGAGVELFYDTEDDPEFDRVEQTGEMDLPFLNRLCNDAGLCLKVTDTQINIFDEQKYEGQDPFTTIKKGDPYIKSFKFRTRLNDVYKACRVEYHNAKTKMATSYTFTPPKPPNTGRVLVINQHFSSIKEAERIAKKRLREKNREETTFSFVLLGDITYSSGLTVNLEGFGKFDGKYIISQVTQGQQSGFETRIELRKCLEGY